LPAADVNTYHRYHSKLSKKENETKLGNKFPAEE